jgi:hypothetical protein
MTGMVGAGRNLSGRLGRGRSQSLWRGSKLFQPLQVHEFNSAYFEVTGGGQVMVPAIPVSMLDTKSCCRSNRPVIGLK